MRVILIMLFLAALSTAQQFTDLVVDAENSKVFGTLYPNEDGSFILVVKNVGEANAMNVQVQLSSSSDISLTPSTLTIGKIERQESVSVPVKIAAGDIDPSKTHTVSVGIKNSGFTYDPLSEYQSVNDQWGVWTVPLEVSSRTPVLSPQVSTAGSVTPGEYFTMNITLRNIGEGAAKNVELKVSPPTDIGVSGDSLIRRYRIEPGESLSASFRLLLSEDAEGELYDIPFSFAYSDLSEEERSEESSATSIDVVAPATLSLSNLRYMPSVLRESQPSSLSMRIENTGKGDADNIEVSIVSDLGSQNSFVGKLEKDEDSSVSFVLLPNAAGSYPSKITLTYEDDLGRHSMTKELEITVYEDPLVKVLPYAAIALVIIALIFVFALKRK